MRDRPLILSSDEVSASELATLMEIDVGEVLRSERDRKLFSFQRPRRSSEHVFPVYQLAPEIQVLIPRVGPMLGWSGATLHQFFSAKDPDLAQLCVRELVCGAAFQPANVGLDAQHLLALTSETRLEYVLDAAERLKNILAGWN